MNREIWAFTGVSGSGRKEVVAELVDYAKTKGKKITEFDVGERIKIIANENNIVFHSERILNIDKTALSLLRALAIQSIIQDINADTESDLIIIGMHALFIWKGALIPGVSYSDLLNIELNGIVNIVDDVAEIYQRCLKNPTWKGPQMISVSSLQRWIMEEELLSEISASIKGVPMYVHARIQDTENLYHFFFSKRKRVYVSYPLTAIMDNERLKETIQKEYISAIKNEFYVFNPLDIKDKTNLWEKETYGIIKTRDGQESDIIDFSDGDSKLLIDSRTITRDYRFIQQSDAVVVIYPTDKSSQGVAAEMIYAHAHQIPVFMYYEGSISPFHEAIAIVYKTFDELFEALKDFNSDEVPTSQ